MFYTQDFIFNVSNEMRTNEECHMQEFKHNTADARRQTKGVRRKASDGISTWKPSNARRQSQGDRRTATDAMSLKQGVSCKILDAMRQAQHVRCKMSDARCTPQGVKRNVSDERNQMQDMISKT